MYLVTDDNVADGEVEDGKQENDWSYDRVGHGDHQDEDVRWD